MYGDHGPNLIPSADARGREEAELSQRWDDFLARRGPDDGTWGGLLDGPAKDGLDPRWDDLVREASGDPDDWRAAYDEHCDDPDEAIFDDLKAQFGLEDGP